MALFAEALASARELRDFHHRSWTSENGIGAVRYLHQGKDGFLWLTTSKGVFRFDGIRFQSIDDASHGLARNKELDSAFPARAGGLWLSTQRQGMLHWNGEELKAFPDRRCTPSRGDGRIVEAQDGSLWIRSSAGLGHLQDGVCRMMGPADGYPGGFASDLLVDRRGTLWVKMPSGVMYYLPAGRTRFEISPSGKGAVGDIAYIHEAPDGSVWLSDHEGLRAITDPGGLPLPPAPNRKRRSERFVNFTFAPDGTLWAANSAGLVRFHRNAIPRNGWSVDAHEGESFTMAQGLSADVIWALIVDREGSIWIGTNSGLDQLRPTALSTVKLPSRPEHQLALAAGNSGDIWVGSRGLPLTRIDADGSIHTFSQTRQSIAVRRDFHGAIWSAGFGDHSLWRSSGTSLLPVSYPTEKVELAAAIALDKNEEPWISTVGPHVYHRVASGEWQRMDETLGRKPGVFGAMAGDEHGNVWFAFSTKLVKWNGRTFERYSFSEGPLNVSVAALGFREDRVWIAGMNGIVLFRSGEFRRLRWKDEDLAGRILGVVETVGGELWLNGSSGIVHVPSPELKRWLRDPAYAVSAERLDALDGLVGLNGDRVPDPSAIQSPDGRLWFATTKALMWLDPAVLEKNRNRVPPPVQITSVTGDGVTYSLTKAAKLSAQIEKFQFDYTALSLAVPERVKFRYKLEGIDKDWNDVGQRRQAFYNSLPPGNYRFRVMACNDAGVWNEEGASFQFFLVPAFYQTWWFLALSALPFGFLIWFLVRLRIVAITRQLEARLAVRLDERERIARELHDTLLQGLLGLMLRFQFAADELPAQSPAKTALVEALDQAERVMSEGRERVKNLRNRHSEGGDLVEDLTSIGHQLSSLSPAAFELFVEGTRRVLQDVIHAEVVLVAREAIMNAFKHSGAKAIRVELNYQRRRFSLNVQDNGKGIAPAILKCGNRENHWGLPGMRERMRKLGADFAIQAPTEGGTRIVLKIPASIAYPADPSPIQRMIDRGLGVIGARRSLFKLVREIDWEEIRSSENSSENGKRDSSVRR